MSEFRKIPGWDGYFINAQGLVRSRYGELAVDAKGRVSLYTAEAHRRRSLPVSELMLLAGFEPAASLGKLDPGAELAKNRKLEADLKEAEDVIANLKLELVKAGRVAAYQRKLNAMLWSRLRRLLANLPRRKKELAERLESEQDEWNDLTVSMAADSGLDYAEAWDE